MENIRVAFWVLGIAVIVQSVLLSALALRVYMPSEATLRSGYYAAETATLVSPHHLREVIERGENPFVLVDVRKPEHYALGHIIGAVNIPAESDMAEKFRVLQKENPDKKILVYCYTQVCMLGRTVGNELARHGISVRELGVGFHEWKHYWREWNYAWEWDDIAIDELVAIGSTPGTYIPDLMKMFQDSGCGSEPGYDC